MDNFEDNSDVDIDDNFSVENNPGIPQNLLNFAKSIHMMEKENDEDSFDEDFPVENYPHIKYLDTSNYDHLLNGSFKEFIEATTD